MAPASGQHPQQTPVVQTVPTVEAGVSATRAKHPPRSWSASTPRA